MDSGLVKGLQFAFETESKVRRIITDQEIYGFLFDKQRASFYVYVLEEYKVRLRKEIRPYLKLEVVQPYTVEVKKPFLKSGEYSGAVKSWFGDEAGLVGGAFSRIEFVEPDISKRQRLIKQLINMGWEPESFTEKGSPQITVNGAPCPSLLKISSSIGKLIATWYTYRHRQSQIKGWLSRIRPDNRLSAEANTLGTPTARFRHKTVVNVPKAAKSVLFGAQMRSLFIVPKDMVMVGYDASGLELRMLAHYLNDAKFTRELLEGDIHTANQKAAGLPSRDAAKTFIYAFNYSAGVAKLGQIVGGGAKEGTLMKKKFLRANPKLEKLIDRVKTASERGYLLGLDGRKVRMRRDKETKEIQTHKALNTLLQSAGAIVMKNSTVLLDKWIKSTTLRAYKIGDFHDEGIMEVHPDDVEEVMELCVKSVVEAGRLLELNIELDADVHQGRSWRDVH